jgi:histidinol-phosphate aminotransferase
MPITLEELPLRPELRGQVPYGAPQLDVPVRLNTNENPYPPPESVAVEMGRAITAAAQGIDRYPDREAWELRSALAKYLMSSVRNLHGDRRLESGLDARSQVADRATPPPSSAPARPQPPTPVGADFSGGMSDLVLTARNIWPANGSNEVMSQLLGAFGGPGRRILAFTPSYSMYPEYARNTHTEYLTCPRASDFTVDVAAALAAVAEWRPSVVVVANPNNPTGTSTPLASIRQLAKGVAASGSILVVDEAYQEFSNRPDNTALALLPEFGNVVVCRTMSKAFAFAGGRLGYLAAAEAVVDACRVVRLPYHLSTQSQVLARVALAHADELLGQVAALRQARDELLTRLPQLGVAALDSDANFVLFGPFADRHDVFERLLASGVLVREVGPDGWLRVTAGTPAEMEAFYSALEKVLEGIK